MGAQTKRVSRALDRHPAGVCQVDFLLPNVIDGLAPITRLAARVKDLRDAGEEIEVIGERYGCAVYARVRAAVTPAPAPTPVLVDEPDAAQPTLFDVQARPAIFDDNEAA